MHKQATLDEAKHINVQGQDRGVLPTKLSRNPYQRYREQ
jgi:hypothetical protein